MEITLRRLAGGLGAFKASSLPRLAQSCRPWVAPSPGRDRGRTRLPPLGQSPGGCGMWGPCLMGTGSCTPVTVATATRFAERNITSAGFLWWETDGERGGRGQQGARGREGGSNSTQPPAAPPPTPSAPQFCTEPVSPRCPAEGHSILLGRSQHPRRCAGGKPRVPPRTQQQGASCCQERPAGGHRGVVVVAAGRQHRWHHAHRAPGQAWVTYPHASLHCSYSHPVPQSGSEQNFPLQTHVHRDVPVSRSP